MSKGLYVTGKQSEYEASLASNTVSFSFIARNYATHVRQLCNGYPG
ncbi:MAG: hypothetical protein U5L72_12025 [Bacteroidales bacterium]|nr:hypothetical protein [Bacteroidales bacterium]